MDQEPRPAGPDVTGEPEQRTPDQIRADIDATRDELGDTVAAVAEKADVKAQVRDRAAGAKQAARQKKDELLSKAKGASPDSASGGVEQVKAKAQEDPLLFAVGGALLLGFLLGRRRGRRGGG